MLTPTPFFQISVLGVPHICCLFVHSRLAGDMRGSAKRSKQATAVTVTKQLVTVSGMEGRLKFMIYCHPGYCVGSEVGMQQCRGSKGSSSGPWSTCLSCAFWLPDIDMLLLLLNPLLGHPCLLYLSV